MPFHTSVESLLAEESAAREKILKKEKHLNSVIQGVFSPEVKSKQSDALIRKYSPRKGDNPQQGAFFNEKSKEPKQQPFGTQDGWLESL